jgi:uncharacterized membrane protein YqjE
VHCYYAEANTLRLKDIALFRIGDIMNHDTINGRNLASLLAEIKDEVWDFLETRIIMLKTELSEKSRNLKTAALLLVTAGLLLMTAGLLMTAALVSLIAAAFPDSTYRWFFALIIVGLLWSIFAALTAYFARRQLQLKGILPRRTIEVLKNDEIWVRTEIRSHL